MIDESFIDTFQDSFGKNSTQELDTLNTKLLRYQISNISFFNCSQENSYCSFFFISNSGHPLFIIFVLEMLIASINTLKNQVSAAIKTAANSILHVNVFGSILYVNCI